MVKIKYFVHGTTYDNASDRCSGWKQVELNDLGKEQAKKLGEIVKNEKFDAIFSSDLVRAIDSAALVFPGVEIIKDARLRECNYGDFDGESKDLVIYENHIDIPFPNGESLKDVEKRIKSFIDFLQEEYKDKSIAIVSHRAPQLAFEVLTKNINWQEANANDWRKTKNWQPGWEYIIKK
jgi:broad specificity phosphatase PhoE